MAGLFFLLRLVLLFVLLSWLGRVLRRWLASSKPQATKMIGDTLQQCSVCKHYLTAQSEPCERADCPRKTDKAATFLLIFALISGWANAAQADSGGRYLVQVDGQNAAVSLVVNDIPVERWTLDKAGSAGASLNHWLRPGGNSIRIKATPIHPNQPSTFHAHAWFMGLSAANGMSTVDLLKTDRIPASAEGLVISFNVPSAPLLSIWTVESAAPDSAAITKTVGAFCASLSAAISSGKSPLDIAALALERQDSAKAYGGAATPQQLEVAVQNGHSGLEVSPVPTALDLAFDPVSETGVIRVVRKDGMPLFAARMAGQTFAVPALLVGRKNGVWFVLRRSF